MLYLILLLTLIDTTSVNPTLLDNDLKTPIGKREIYDKLNTEHYHPIKELSKKILVSGKQNDITYDELMEYLYSYGNHFDDIFWGQSLLYRNAHTDSLYDKVKDRFYDEIYPNIYKDENLTLNYISYFIAYEHYRSIDGELHSFSRFKYGILYQILTDILSIDGIFDISRENYGDFKEIILDFCSRVGFNEVPEYSVPYLTNSFKIYTQLLSEGYFPYWKIYIQRTFLSINWNTTYDDHDDGSNFYDLFYTDEIINIMIETLNNYEFNYDNGYDTLHEWMLYLYIRINDMHDYNNETIEQLVLDILTNGEYGDHVHMSTFSVMYNYKNETLFDKQQYREGYLSYIEGEGYVYDDGKITFKSSLPIDEIEKLHYSYNEVKAGFFNLFPDIEPLESDTNETVSVVIFPSPESYWLLTSILYWFDGTENGGLYIESRSQFYTYKRPSDWNLSLNDLFRHEYVHYLDGRYVKPGHYGETDFYDWDVGRHTWWSEGIAEFVSNYNMFNGYEFSEYNIYLIGRAREIFGFPGIHNRFNFEYAMSPDWSYSYMVYPLTALSWIYLVENHMNVIQHTMNLIRDGKYDEYKVYVDSIKVNDIMSEEFDDMVQKIYLGRASSVVNVNNQIVKMYDYNDTDVDIELLETRLGVNLDIIKTTPRNFVGYIDTLYIDGDVNMVIDTMSSIANSIRQHSDVFTGFDYTLASVIGQDSNQYVYQVFFPQFGVYNTPTNIFMEELVEQQMIKVFPNPSTDYIIIDNVVGEEDVIIYNTMGRKVYEGKVRGRKTIDTRNFGSGVYFIKFNEKVIKITKV